MKDNNKGEIVNKMFIGTIDKKAIENLDEKDTRKVIEILNKLNF